MYPLAGFCFVAAALMFGASPAGAGEKQAVEAVAVYLAPPESQEVKVTPSGNVHLKGEQAFAAMFSQNELINGLLTWEGNGNLDDKLDGNGGGTGILQVGTWAGIDSGKPVFTPSGNVWRTKWEFKGNLNGPYTVRVIGHGLTGEVEGMQFKFEAQWVDIGVEHYVGEILDPAAKK